MKLSILKRSYRYQNKVIKSCLFIIILFNTSWSHASWSRTAIQEMVALEAARQDFSVPLALAVAEVESNFDPYARSHVDARGVMQIMPKTAEEDLGVRSASLYNPRVNIRAGVRFLKHLVNVYDGRVDIALSHYNGGSRVRQSNGGLAVIPATQDYVNKVLKYEKKYLAHALVKHPSSTHYILTNEKKKAFVSRSTTETLIAQREALDDFENGDPLDFKTLPENLESDENNESNSKQVIIHKLKNLVKYNQNRHLYGAGHNAGRDYDQRRISINKSYDANEGIGKRMGVAIIK